LTLVKGKQERWSKKDGACRFKHSVCNKTWSVHVSEGIGISGSRYSSKQVNLGSARHNIYPVRQLNTQIDFKSLCAIYRGPVQGSWVWWTLGPLSEHEHGSSQGNHHRKTDTSSYASGTSLFDCNVILTQLRVVDTSANRRDAPTSRQKGNMKPLVLSFVITLVSSREKLRAIRRKLDRRHREHFVGSVAC